MSLFYLLFVIFYLCFVFAFSIVEPLRGSRPPREILDPPLGMMWYVTLRLATTWVIYLFNF